MADGNVHTATITYSGPGTKLLDVILDNIDLFPPTPSNPSGGVVFDMTTIGLTNGTNAWVGFTGSTYARRRQPGHPDLVIPAGSSDG